MEHSSKDLVISRLYLFTSTISHGVFGLRSRYDDWLRAGRSGDGIPVGVRFSAPVQNGPGAHPTSCIMGTGSFPGGKEWPGRDADHSPPSSAVTMKGWSYTSTPPMGRTACIEPQCLHRGALCFTLFGFRDDNIIEMILLYWLSSLDLSTQQ